MYRTRIERVQKKLEVENLSAYYSDAPIDIYYLTGMDVSTGSLLIEREKETLIVDGRYFEACRNSAPVEVALQKNGILKELLQNIETLAVPKDLISIETFQGLETKCASVKAVSNWILELRRIKDPDEMEKLREAAKLGSRGFDFLLENLREGITEKQLVRELEIFWLKEGGDQLAFSPIIAFGQGSSSPHYRPKEIPLKKGQPVLMDIGVVKNRYHSDMTRVVFFGEPEEKMVEIYEIVREAQQKALDSCRPGITMIELDEAARSYIRARGYEEEFCHGLGHGIGLDIHEEPYVSKKAVTKDIPAKPGMAITIEPGVYLPGLGGVRIEDTILITEDSYENLTRRPKEIIIIN